MAAIVNGCSDGRGITGEFLFPCPLVRSLTPPTDGSHALPVCLPHIFPKRFAGSALNCDYRRIWLASHHHDQLIALKQRCASDAEERFGHTPFLCCFSLPDEFASRKFETNQSAFSSEGIAETWGESRGATWAVVITKRISESA